MNIVTHSVLLAKLGLMAMDRHRDRDRDRERDRDRDRDADADADGYCVSLSDSIHTLRITRLYPYNLTVSTCVCI